MVMTCTSYVWGREYELTGDINIKREADYWRAIELSMMRKAAISYYPSYVEINAIHAIDPEIKAKAITAYVYDHFLTSILFPAISLLLSIPLSVSILSLLISVMK